MLQPVDVLGAIITPAVLISAAALLLLSTASRLGRVNDRLQGKLEGSKERPQRDCLILAELAGLADRLLLLRSAVIGLYATIALLILTGIAAGMYAAVPAVLTSLISISVGLLGAVAFLYSIMLLIRESSIAVRTTLGEIAYVHELADLHRRL